MKEGIKEGLTAELEITVDESMYAEFGGNVVHKLYSTTSLVHHIEWVARNAILPFVEEGEATMGCNVNLKHKQPAIPGSKILLKATITRLYSNKIDCLVEATGPNGQIAEARTTQAVVKRRSLEERIHQLEELQEHGSEFKIPQ